MADDLIPPLDSPPATDPTAPKQDTTDPELFHTAGDIDAIRAVYGWSSIVTTNHGYPDGLDVEALFADVPAALKNAVNPTSTTAFDATPKIQPANQNVNTQTPLAPEIPNGQPATIKGPGDTVYHHGAVVQWMEDELQRLRSEIERLLLAA